MKEFLIEYDMYLNGGYVGNDIIRIHSDDRVGAVIKLHELLSVYDPVIIIRITELTK